MSVDLVSSSSGADGDFVELSTPIGSNQVATFNVILVPEIQSSAQRWSGPGQRDWVLPLFTQLGSCIQVFEFRYRLPNTFSWSALVDLGNVFVKCMIDMHVRYRQQLTEVPLMAISHGLGGIIIKRALTILNDNYYNPTCRGLLDLCTGLIFLGTPHAIHRKGVSPEHLDLILCAAMKRPSKEVLSTIREEIPFVWNVCAKFEEIAYIYPVISAYENWPSRVVTGLFRSRTELLVNESFSTTRMRSEELIKVEADHYTICSIGPGTDLYQSIVRSAKGCIEVARNFSAEPTLTVSNIDLEDWQSTAASRTGVHKVNIANISEAITPAEATTGSSNLSPLIDLPTAKDTPVSSSPAVKLPCYMLRQNHKSAACIGRSNILRMLDEVLLPDKQLSDSALLNDLRTFAICGLGGMGKTQIANEFASTRKHMFDAVFFVSADSESKLSENFNSIAMQLGLSESMDSENRAVNRDKVIQWLNEPIKRPRDRSSEDLPISTDGNASYLLIFDNADNPELLTEFWPVAGTGSILITSRDPHARSHFYAMQGVDLEPLTLDHAAELLQTVTGFASPSEKDDARRVSKRLGGLPLALTQVAGLLQRRKLTFEEFLEFYNEPAFLTEVHQSKDRGVHSSYEHMLFNVWSFEELKPESLRLLEICSILDPDQIKESILTSGGLVLLQDFPATPLALENARSELLKSSLLKRYPEEKELVIHRVLQDAIRSRMTEDHLIRVFGSAANLVLAAWPTQHLVFAVEPRHWPISATLLSHIEKLREVQVSSVCLTVDPKIAMSFANLMIKAGWFHCERGNYEDALKFCDTAEAICAQHPQHSAATLADLDFPYAWVCSFLHQHELKHLHARRKVEYHLTHNSGSDNDWLCLGIAYTEFSMYFVDVENFKEAVLVATAALDAYMHCTYYRNGTQMPILPRIWAGWAYLGLGQLDEAEEMVRPCLEWVESTIEQWSFNALRTGAALYTLGNIRKAQGRDEESFKLHERALDHYQSTMGKTHFQTAKAQMKISEHCLQMNMLEQALSHIDEALEAWSNRESFGGYRARAYYRKAQVLESLNNKLKAKGILLKAEKLRRIWLKAHCALREPRDERDYDSLVPCWTR